MLLPGTGVRIHRFKMAVALCLLLTLLAGCASAPSPSPTGTTGLTRSLPRDIRERGYILVATDATYAPAALMGDDGATLIGLDPDIAAALGKKLGIELRMQNSSFDAIVPGLVGYKFDAAMTWMNDTPTRRKVLDLIDYSSDGSSMFVPTAAPNQPDTPEELCGLRVAVQKGTSQQTEAQEQSTKCSAQSKAPIHVLVYPDQNSVNLTLQSNRADVAIADSPTASWQVHQSGGRFKLSGKPYGEVYHGIALPKGSPLVKPVARAFQEIMNDGTYYSILTKWDMPDAAIQKPLINGKPLDD